MPTSATTAIGVPATTNGRRPPHPVRRRSDQAPTTMGSSSAPTPSPPTRTPMTVVEPVNWRATVGRYVETTVIDSARPNVGSASSARRWSSRPVRPRLERARPVSVVVQDDERWLAALRAREDGALAELRALLLRAARFELRRRGVPARELDDLVEEAADDAMVAILRKLDAFRGDSRFTTWA